MSRDTRTVIGWCHIYAGAFVALTQPASGAVILAVGLCWWAAPRKH